ncbi:penicillin-binding protein 2 [Moraxella nasibovis]|uniref:penicillin-binding protein 2 n=1 Tax=Moraxella nasibovis TaxID=2904120 RepID=UPI00240F63E4|nr:penicillin-binding protein 2 [Moraxella nasibovis]WFF37909.1 penicillin-binding protein 2 [Moraxella nasibovis]
MRDSINSDDQNSRVFSRRIGILGLIILLGTGVLLARYGYLQVAQHSQFVTAADNNRIKLISNPPSRGHIYDRNGILLADNKPVFTVIISPDEVENAAHTLALLKPIFALSDEEVTDILARIDKSKNNPVTVKINPTEAQIAQFSERKPFFQGVSIQTKLTRTYPYDDLFAHVIGYVGRINDKESKAIKADPVSERLYAGTDLIGKLGIEKQYEDILLGEPGHQSVETNAHGDVLRRLDTKPPVAGNDIYLSLDYGLQKVAADQLGGRRGAIVALDPRNGEVLAFVSNPSFDPNPFISGISSKAYGALRDDIDQPLYNRALQGLYPPASTIKPFEAMGILHYGIMDWQDTIFDPGYFSLPGDSHRFRDWKRGGHGTVNMAKSIIMSVDTYYYKNAHTMGIDRLHEWMTAFGFGKKTGIDLPNEKAGLMPSPKWKKDTYNKDWLPGETISVSIGQGAFLASPLQIAAATATTANKGLITTPHFLKRSEGAKPVFIPDKPTGRINFNGTEEDWLRMHKAMEDTLIIGTGKAARSPSYRSAGKTGTAQVKSIAQGKSYNKAALSERHWDHAWFMGFAPVEKPEIALAILVENGGGGGSVAAPIGRVLFDYWMLGRHKDPVLPPSESEMIAIRAEKQAKMQAKIDAYLAAKAQEEQLKKQEAEQSSAASQTAKPAQ